MKEAREPRYFNCAWCGTLHLERKGGKPQRFCPGATCRREYQAVARELGAAVLDKLANGRAGGARAIYRPGLPPEPSTMTGATRALPQQAAE